MVDTGDLKSPDRKIVPVQVRSWAPLTSLTSSNKVQNTSESRVISEIGSRHALISRARGSVFTPKDFLDLPDRDQVVRQMVSATELGVEVSSIEKDWYACQALKAVSSIESDNFTIIFSGGTSLSKAHGLIQRFSEDGRF